MKEPKPLSPERREVWLRNSALHFLAQRISSEENLRRVLTRRAQRRIAGAEEADIRAMVDKVVAFCREQRLIDDVAYAETKAAVAARRGQSRRNLSRMLQVKGVAESIVTDAASVIDDALSAVRFAKRRRLGPWRLRSAEDAVMKDVAAFARGGFSSDLAFRTARMSIEEAEAILYGEALPEE
ncbi:regulatory protein RecX [Agaricicola taiwanensis]|uniref:Regulatory protein RecX n=1 Tax=Agaricicola taiwanensis TaxID=591372 RepID=A0A8J2VNU0_9RHOB|nr:regulatory protein RecX [Agaricicola taiwanensis]GGE34878.1 regulatory protein RecX [Agaricicola taiwanensis]